MMKVIPKNFNVLTFDFTRWISCSNLPKTSSVKTSSELLLKKASMWRRTSSIVRAYLCCRTKPDWEKALMLLDRNGSLYLKVEMFLNDVLLLTFVEDNLRRLFQVSDCHRFFECICGTTIFILHRNAHTAKYLMLSAIPESGSPMANSTSLVDEW